MLKRVRSRSVHCLSTCEMRTAAQWRLPKKNVSRPQIKSEFSQDFQSRPSQSFVADFCTHFLQLLVWKRKKKQKLGLKLGKELKRIPNKYGHMCGQDFNQDHHSFVVEYCTHFPQLLVWERKEKLKLGLKVGNMLKRIPNEYGHISWECFLTPSPTSPRYANVTSTKNDLHY